MLSGRKLPRSHIEREGVGAIGLHFLTERALRVVLGRQGVDLGLAGDTAHVTRLCAVSKDFDAALASFRLAAEVAILDFDAVSGAAGDVFEIDHAVGEWLAIKIDRAADRVLRSLDRAAAATGDHRQKQSEAQVICKRLHRYF